jgi:predicted regulator of Ras-like GTPase activity (Roadblock/LC7/MglB family)
MDASIENQIKNLLKPFRIRTGVTTSFLFNNDGLVIAIDQESLSEDEDFYQSISAICAGIISFAEQGILMTDSSNNVKDIVIQGGNQIESDSFTITIDFISNEIIFACIFPSVLNYSVIKFELKNTTQSLIKLFNNDNMSENASIQQIKT